MQQSKTATLHFPRRGPAAPPAQVPQLFCVLEGGCAIRPVSRHALVGIDKVTLGRAAHAEVGRSNRDGDGTVLAIRLQDRWLSSDHAEIRRQGDEYLFRDVNSRNGSRINGASVVTAILRDGDLIEIGQTFLAFRARASLPETDHLDFAISADQIIPGIATLHADLNAQFSNLGRIAKSDVAVAILGETGTGKELVARAVHQLSGRAGKFVPVNCGAIPRELTASELFGHTKGAFTGAISDKLGLIRSADRGTLFLDEIGELPHDQQVVLLRVLQDRTVTPVGGSPHEVDFRLVVATNRDVDAALSDGLFRRDLWARAKGFVMRLPPLRERREDLGLILGSLLAQLRPADRSTLVIHGDATGALLRYHWPNNIRELEQCMRAALALCLDNALTVAELPAEVQAENRPENRAEVRAENQAENRAETPASHSRTTAELDSDRDLREEVHERRRNRLCALLERTGGNISKVAKLMDEHRTQIQRWIKRYGIDLRPYKLRRYKAS